MPVIYTLNDEKQSPQVFVVEVATGDVVGTFTTTPALPTGADPEAICLDVKTGKLFIADIGDNDGDRTNCALYALPEPGPGNHGTLPCKKYPISYPWGPTNAEALAINPVSGERYIITKEPNGSRLCRLPATLSTGGNEVTGIRTLTECPNVTDAAFTTNGRWLLVRSANRQAVIVLDRRTWKKVGTIPAPSTAKGESIAVEPGGKSFLIGSEGQDSPIFRVIIPTKYRGTYEQAQTVTPTPGTPTTPTQPAATKPGQIIPMKFWKLTLPIGSQGDPDEILMPALATFEHSKYFFDSNNRVVFRCPYGGVTTGGSVNPRTELREMWRNGQYDESAWDGNRGNHRMTLRRVSINHVGQVEKQVTFGQLHDAGDDRVMLRYEGTSDTAGDLWVDWGQGKGQGAISELILPGYTLGRVIDKIALNINNTAWRVFIDDVLKADYNGSADGCYFKAGCYPQRSSAEADSDYATVRMGGLTVVHS